MPALCFDRVLAHPMKTRAQKSTPSAVPIQYKMPRRQPVCASRRLETVPSRFSKPVGESQLKSGFGSNPIVSSSTPFLVKSYFSISWYNHWTHLLSSSERAVYRGLSASRNIFGVEVTLNPDPSFQVLSRKGTHILYKNSSTAWGWPELLEHLVR